MKNSYRSMMAALTLCSMSAVSVAGQPLSLDVAGSIEIPHSSGKFDFLRIDSKRQRLLAAHEKDGTSDFLDMQTHALIARLKLGAAVDTAMDPESNFYYVSVQESERVAVVDASTLKEVKSIKVSGPTDAIIYEPKNHMVYVTHDEGAEVWVIDPQARDVSICRTGQDPEILKFEQELIATDVLPGFRCQVSEFFELPGTV